MAETARANVRESGAEEGERSDTPMFVKFAVFNGNRGVFNVYGDVSAFNDGAFDALVYVIKQNFTRFVVDFG